MEASFDGWTLTSWGHRDHSWGHTSEAPGRNCYLRWLVSLQRLYCGKICICPSVGTTDIHKWRQMLQVLVWPLGNPLQYVKICSRIPSVAPYFFLLNTFHLGRETSSLKWWWTHSRRSSTVVTFVDHLPYFRKLSNPILPFFNVWFACMQHEKRSGL